MDKQKELDEVWRLVSAMLASATQATDAAAKCAPSHMSANTLHDFEADVTTVGVMLALFRAVVVSNPALLMRVLAGEGVINAIGTAEACVERFKPYCEMPDLEPLDWIS
jgi:hypothetical protein